MYHVAFIMHHVAAIVSQVPFIRYRAGFIVYQGASIMYHVAALVYQAVCIVHQVAFIVYHAAFIWFHPGRGLLPLRVALTPSARLWYYSANQKGAIMSTPVGTFRVEFEIENPLHPGERRLVAGALADTGAELSWVPASVLESLGVGHNRKEYFRQADGTVLERWTGIVIIGIGGKRTGDDVVFGEPGDLTLLGARTLEGLNFRVDPRTKQLVDAGPAPAASAA